MAPWVGAGVVAAGARREIPVMRLELLIDGMLAVHAKHAVFTALAAVTGVQRAEVELGRAVLEVQPDDADELALEHEARAAVEAAGFSVREVRRLPRTLPTL